MTSSPPSAMPVQGAVAERMPEGGAAIGAILAGGRSRRFGGEKAVAEVAGVAMIERVRRSLAAVVGEVVVVADRAGRFPGLAAEEVLDGAAGLGPLSGLRAALLHARGRGASGALVAPCDTPFVPPALFAALLERASAGGADAVVPASGGPRGVEPLCAWYSAAALDAVTLRLASSDRSTRRLLAEIRVAVLSPAEVCRIGDPSLLFLNVNTPAELRRAESAALARPAEPPVVV